MIFVTTAKLKGDEMLSKYDKEIFHGKMHVILWHGVTHFDFRDGFMLKVNLQNPCSHCMVKVQRSFAWQQEVLSF